MKTEEQKLHDEKMKALEQRKASLDWELIEREYRAGIKSIRQIATDHGIAHPTLIKRAKLRSWTRGDLGAQIKSKADDIVARDAAIQVRKTLQKAVVVAEANKSKRKDDAIEKQIADDEFIEAGANEIAGVRLTHRKDIRRATRVAMKLLEELEGMAGFDAAETLDAIGKMMRDENWQGKDALNDTYMRIISLPNRMATMKSFTDAAEKLIKLERQAYGLDETINNVDDPFKSMLMTIATGNGSSFKTVKNDPDLSDNHDE